MDQYFGETLRRQTIITTSKDSSNEVIATQADLLELVEAANVSNQIKFTDDDSSVEYTFSDICQTTTNGQGVVYCLSQSVLDLFYDPTLITNNPTTKKPDFLLTVQKKINTLTDAQVFDNIYIHTHVEHFNFFHFLY